MQLNELLKVIEILEYPKVNFNELQPINKIAYHSANVEAGDLFVAIKGYVTDGHKYLDNAYKNGAVVAVVEYLQPEIAIPQFQVKDGRLALAKLANCFYNYPSFDMTVVGITASNGKTTCSYMTDAIFKAHGAKTGMIGTVVIKADDEEIPANLTTPESLDLQRHLFRMREKHCEYVTMEISSSSLETKRSYGTHFAIAAFNNITREHIDVHGTFEQYLAVKSSLIENLGADSYAILNLDCPEVASLVDRTLATTITYGVNNKSGNLVCQNLDLSSGRAKFIVEVSKPFKVGNNYWENLHLPIELEIPGYHSVINAMSAIAIGLACNVPLPAIQKSFSLFKGVERRFEFIYEKDFIIIDDHFANAGNIDVTLETLKFMKYRKLILVYAIRGSRGPIVNKENADAIVKWSNKLGFDHLIVTRSIGHTISKDYTTKAEEEALTNTLKAANLDYSIHDSLICAIKEALTNVKPGDIILLAGAQGMDYGANVILNMLAQDQDEFQRLKTLLPLTKRVCGMEIIKEMELLDKNGKLKV